jgi:hypothetical protein
MHRVLLAWALFFASVHVAVAAGVPVDLSGFRRESGVVVREEAPRQECLWFFLSIRIFLLQLKLLKAVYKNVRQFLLCLHQKQ